MPADDGRDIVIISDLHMASGYDRRRGTYDRNEDFFYDGALSRFVDDLLRRATVEPRRWRLVILGDFLDFLQVPEPKNNPHGLTSAETTVAKLDVIAAGHSTTFAALARFLAAGHQLDFVIGNHDAELIWPAAQQKLKELIQQHATAEIIAAITFHPWIFYVPGVVYAEHGQQYDDVNSFTTLLQPFMPSDRSVLELPLGSFFVLYLFNYIERIDPFADNIKPVTRYLTWALRAHPVVALGTLGYHVRFFFQVLRKTSDLSAEEQRLRRERYRNGRLRAHAAEVGLPFAIVEELDKLAAVPVMSSKWRQLKALLVEPALPSLPLLAGLIAIYQALRQIRGGARSFMLLCSGIGALVWRERRLLRPATDSGSYLLGAAQKIHALLDKAGAAVPAYVFGHTHTAELSPLAENDEPPRYLNTGTWTPIVPASFELLGTRERFTFVQITRDPANERILAELMLWNDAAVRAEPLPLLMS